MGTDIHGVFQTRRNGVWETVRSEYDFDRHYALFACLADVRNGFGFAGVPTHAPVVPISSPRGLPEDLAGLTEISISDELASPWEREYREKYAQGEEKTKPITRWLGHHSFSWLTADEILSYSWPKLERTGVVSIEFYKNWDRVSAPDSWSGDISGLGIIVAQNAAEITPLTTHVRINWVAGTKDFDYFVKEVQRLKDQFGEVRFVFGFDS